MREKGMHTSFLSTHTPRAILCSWGALVAGIAAIMVGAGHSHAMPQQRGSDSAVVVRSSIRLHLPSQYTFNEYLLAVDGARLVYLGRDSYNLPLNPLPGQRSCYPLNQIRLVDLHTQSDRLVAHLPPPSTTDCIFYDSIQFAAPWIVYSVERKTGESDTISLQAFNLRTKQRRVLATSPQVTRRGERTEIFAWQVSGTTVAWNAVHYQATTTATSVSLADLSSGTSRTLVMSPWFHWGDPRAWGIKGISLSGERLVWTRTTPKSANIILYDWRTRRMTVLTHNNISVAPRIYGTTVAWLVSKAHAPEGDVRVYDLRTRKLTAMPTGIGYNIEIGDGLVSWTPLASEAPLYLVRRHVLHFYRTSTADRAQQASPPNVRIFGREVLVATILHFNLGGPGQKRVYRLETY